MDLKLTPFVFVFFFFCFFLFYLPVEWQGVMKRFPAVKLGVGG